MNVKIFWFAIYKYESLKFQESYIILAVRLQYEIYADTKVLERFSVMEAEERNVSTFKQKNKMCFRHFFGKNQSYAIFSFCF